MLTSRHLEGSDDKMNGEFNPNMETLLFFLSFEPVIRGLRIEAE